MADERGLREPERVHEATQRVREVSEAITRARFRGIAETRKVDREHRGAAGERPHVVAPRLGESAQTVDEDDGGAAPPDDLLQAEPAPLPPPPPPLPPRGPILPHPHGPP